MQLLSRHFDNLGTFLEKPPHVVLQNEPVDASAEPSHWRSVIEYISHNRASSILVEEIVMVEAVKWPPNLRITKMVRTVECSDPACEPLSNAKVICFPRDLFIQVEEARGYTFNRSLLSCCRRLNV